MSTPKSIKVVAADDHELVLRGIASMFQAEGDIDLVAQAANGGEALQFIKTLSPDIAVLNLHMPDMSGLEVISTLGKMTALPRFVILASYISYEEFMQAMQLNVRGMVLKKMPASLLTRCVRKVHAGEEFIEKDMFRIAFGKLLQHSAAQKELATLLTARELTVVKHAVNGLSNKRVARELSISEGTVKLHLHRAYEKLRVHGRMGLMQLVHKNGLL